MKTAQVINYLKASGFEIGLLFNFGAGSLEYKKLYSIHIIREICVICGL